MPCWIAFAPLDCTSGYRGEVLEHHTFFLIDPSGNWLEFKHYSHPEAVLGCRDQAVVGDSALR
jgi:uncharacterized protein